MKTTAEQAAQAELEQQNYENAFRLSNASAAAAGGIDPALGMDPQQFELYQQQLAMQQNSASQALPMDGAITDGDGEVTDRDAGAISGGDASGPDDGGTSGGGAMSGDEASGLGSLPSAEAAAASAAAASDSVDDSMTADDAGGDPNSMSDVR